MTIRFSEKPEKLIQLFAVGQQIVSQLDSDKLFDVVVDQTNELIGTSHCSIFLIDKKKQILKPFASKDLRLGFTLPKDQGIAGWVYCNKSTLIVNDAYQDEQFDKNADIVSGIHTKNILCTPLIGRNKNCLGTMQVINKISGPFNAQDEELIAFIAGYVAVALENSMLYENVLELNRAKSKAIGHLSHELKTPLALIGSAFDRIETITQDSDNTKLTVPINRGRRNLDRLKDLQDKVDDIMGLAGENLLKTGYFAMIEDMKYFIDELCEDTPSAPNEIIDRLTQRIEAVFHLEKSENGILNLNDFFQKLVSQTRKERVDRQVELLIDADNRAWIVLDTAIFRTICLGLVKNAIENTPDQGRIAIIARDRREDILVRIKDTGVGITRLNQNNIFKGFFHTQETYAYSSKRPYAFNAGGTGIDLLRIRAWAERMGFSIDVKSTRCRYIPLDKDPCCGNIDQCCHVETVKECMLSGGSSFDLIFPKTIFQVQQ